jgi:hypothetical protein
MFRLLLLAAAVIIPTAAGAWESWLEDARRPVRPRYGISGYPDTTYPRYYYAPRYRPRVIYKYATPRDDSPRYEHKSKGTCYPTVQVVGSQWKDEDGAEESARKGWMEAVRWRHGEWAMDIGNARDYAKRCSRSSVGSVLGETLHRCEVAARPCRPYFEDGK